MVLPILDRFFVADGVCGLPIIASSFSLNVVAFFLAEPARDLDFSVVLKDTDTDSCNELNAFCVVLEDYLWGEFRVEFLAVMTLEPPLFSTTIFFYGSLLESKAVEGI
jgi:hypothetical protein